MNYSFEFGGGLGDVFNQIFDQRCFVIIDALQPDDFAAITIISHNPFAHELFAFHPNAALLDLRSLGYWEPAENLVMREMYGLPASMPSYSPGLWEPQFFAPDRDIALLSRIRMEECVVFSVSAGLPDRSIPTHIIGRLIDMVLHLNLLPVFVGRSYARCARGEFKPNNERVLDLIDRLTVPGVARLVMGSQGVVCCHSAINILSWRLRKPQLLLYPESVFERHIIHRDQWAFGIDFPECVHSNFSAEELPKRIEEFRSLLLSGKSSETVT